MQRDPAKFTPREMENRPILPDAVLAQYGLGEVRTIELKSGGGIDESFVVTFERGQYFFKRRAPGYTAEMLACDHALVQFLVRHAFPTPALVATRHGSTWVEWEGRLYEAYLYVEGLGYISGDVKQIANLGRVMGQYHRLVLEYKSPCIKLPPWKDLAGYLDIGEYVSPRLKDLRLRDQIGEPEIQFVHEVVGQLGRQACQVNQTGLVSLIVHGALEPGNVLFDKEGSVVAWVDWADSALFVRAFDVAHALLKFVGRRPDAVLPGQVGPSLAWSGVESLAGAYRQEIALTEMEVVLLPWLMLACRVTDALWIDEARPMDYRRELGLAKELRGWLMQNATALQAMFCG